MKKERHLSKFQGYEMNADIESLITISSAHVISVSLHILIFSASLETKTKMQLRKIFVIQDSLLES